MSASIRSGAFWAALLWLLTGACASSCGSDHAGSAPGGGAGNDATTTSGAGGGGATAATGGASGSTGGTGNAELDSGSSDARSAGGARDAGDSGVQGIPSSDGSVGDAGIAPVIAAGVRWIGRVDTTDVTGPRFGWSGTGFVARFNGTSLAARLNNGGAFVFKAVVDGSPQPAFATTAGQASYPVASGLASGTHTVALYRQTEGVYGDSQLLGLTIDGGTLVDPPAPPARLIEVVGASVSCGYGDLGTSPCTFTFGTESHWDTYESVAARALEAEVSTVAISGRGVYRNADGTTAGTMPKLFDRILAGSAAPAWDFRVTPHVVVINLGKNDLVLGDPGAIFRDTYLAFTRTLRERYPKAFIVCTTGPNLGEPAHTQQLGHVSAVVATRHTEGDDAIELLDWPEQVAGQIGCDAHPNAAKQTSMGQQLVTLLRERLQW
jgi:lysophospholipase L1-like esterase